MTTTILAIDPGTKYCGYAVLQCPETLVTCGTWIPKSGLRGAPRLLWLVSQIQELLQAYAPQILALEDYVWLGDEEAGIMGRDGMCKLVGAITALSLSPPYPVLYELLPQRWGAQLVGSRQHTKADVARAVNLRLGTTFDGGFHTNHTSDAVGIALVVSDLRTREALVVQTGQPSVGAHAHGQ